MTARIPSNGGTLTTTYDRLNRPVRRNGATDTLAYDLMGRLTLANNPYARITRTYYPNGALETDTLKIATSDTTASTRWTAHVYGLRHRYDLEGRQIALWYPAGILPAGVRDSVVSGYDGVTGALTSVRDLRDSLFTFGYDNAGRLTSQGSPGLSETFAYDADSRLLRRVRFNGAPNWRDSLIYDARGKVVQNAGAADSYGYLPIGPVISSNFASAGSSATYTTDALGNRRTARVVDNQTDGGTDSSKYEAGTGRLVVTTQRHMGVVRPDSTLFWFNEDGSLSGTDVHRVLGCTAEPCVVQSTWILDVRSTGNTYDAAGHLVASTFQFDTIPWLSPQPYATYRRTSAYRYDALGRRVWQRVVRGANCYQKEEITGCLSTLTRTVWEGDQVLFELRGPGDSVAGGAGTSETDWAPGAGLGRVGYVHAGGIDAPLELFKESQVVVPHANWRGVYDSGTCPTSACASTVQFPGGNGSAGVFGDGYNPDAVDWYGSLVWAQQDASGYQYKRNRYYDPKSGRFTQEDPIGLAGGLNVYGFAGGDPVNFSDPFGLCPEGNWVCEIAKALYQATGAFVGGAAGFTGGAATGLACGPLAEVCSPALAVAGAVSVGGASAVAAGKAVDAYYDGVNQMARAGKGRGGNQNPNRDVNRIAKENDLNKAGQRALHDEITDQHHTLDEIREIAKRLADQPKYRYNPPPQTPK